MTLQDVIARFRTTPFLFAGSGITRRYYGLPSWEELLRHFAEAIDSDPFVYQSYKNRASKMNPQQGLLPTVATLIQDDYDKKWFSATEIRSTDALSAVKVGVSPFKAEISEYIKSISQINHTYDEELRKLKNISEKNIAGVITTNYDTFFEKLFKDYHAFVGQDELVFSAIMGIAEIYKIHGSVLRPDSIVINENDYKVFNEKGKYLAAKLMTIFMEYPIIFIGYSLSDQNIQNIIRDIIVCLTKEKIEKLQERFVFVDYQPHIESYEISTYAMAIGEHVIQMTRISLSDFGILYEALAAKRASCPVKLLRRFKDEIYSYAITNEPSALLKVAQLDDPNISEDRLVVSIGVADHGTEGLYSAISADEWYRGVVMGDIERLGYPIDAVLEYRYSGLKRDNQNLPVYRYLSEAKNEYPAIEDDALKTFDDLASATCIKQRNATEKFATMEDVWNSRKNDANGYYLLCRLPECKMNIDFLEKILKEHYNSTDTSLSTKDPNERANIRRLIRMYDYLKWYKNKALSK